MKIGSAVMFMFLSFVALGYLLSDNFNTREALVKIQQQNQKILEENAALQINYDALAQSLAQSEQKVSELTQINLTQQEKINALTEQNSSLKSVASEPKCQVENTELLENLSNTPLTWAILLPLLPVSLATSYGVIVYSKRLKDQRMKNGQPKAYVQLTEDEIKSLIQIRRSR